MGCSILDHVPEWGKSPFSAFNGAPWEATQMIASLVSEAVALLPGEYVRSGDVAIHKTATVEAGAVIKGPAIIGNHCFIACGAYVRGGAYLERDCILGPGSEFKSSFMFEGSKLAHFNFVGDSILGSDVNLEAGSIIANYRNEFLGKEISILIDGKIVETGCEKFGALVGHGVRVGANAVIAPGSVLPQHAQIARLSLWDQSPSSAAN